MDKGYVCFVYVCSVEDWPSVQDYLKHKEAEAMSYCGGQAFSDEVAERVINPDTNRPVYCERPNYQGKCQDCALVNYNRDCYNLPVYKGGKKENR